MNHLAIFCAEYLIFIAALYSVIHVVTKHERKHHLRHIVIIIGGALLAWVVAHVLKDLIHHPRPNLSNPLVPENDPYSFPSGHTTFMFTLAFAMCTFDKKTAVILFVLATLTGISRVIVGVHYWYDIIGGVVIAYIIAKLVTTAAKRFLKNA